MDWSYVSFSLLEGALGLLALLFPVPFLAFAASRHRWITAASPGLVGISLFLTFALVSGATSRDSPLFLTYLPAVGLLICIALIPFSVRALRNKWVSLLHLLTAAGAVFTWFVAAMAISHDWL